MPFGRRRQWRTGILPVLTMLCWFLCLCPPALADDSRPLFIELKEIKPQIYQLHWQLPPTLPSNLWPKIQLADSCGDPANITAPLGQHYYSCSHTLAGAPLSLIYPQQTLPPNGTLIKFQALSGEQHTTMLPAGTLHWQIPAAETRSRIASDYTVLGIQHILEGWDHLLFVTCLLWIAGDLRRVLITITGFTLAHSLTLVLAALAWIRLPVAPVEAVIALSVVFLAAEIAHSLRSGEKRGLTWRYPVVVSSSFGLLHGLGFAAVLNEIGLPQTETITGLIFFNLGVEIGQVLFALSLLGFVALLGQWRQRLAQPVTYGIGIVAAFWVVERVVGMAESVLLVVQKI